MGGVEAGRLLKLAHLAQSYQDFLTYLLEFEPGSFVFIHCDCVSFVKFSI